MGRKTVIYLFTLLVLSSAILAACAQPTPGGASEPPPTLPPAVSAEPTAVPTLEPTAEPTEEPTQEPLEEPTVEAGASEAITLTDGLGRTVTLEAPAQRVISMAPSNTEILFAVGAGPQVVGRDEFSDYPAEAQAVANIGGGFGEYDYETMLSLEPDLVLAAPLSPAEQIETLEGMGFKVFVLENPVELDGIYRSLRTAAQLTGHEAEAEELVADLQRRVMAVEEVIAAVESRPLVFYELDGMDPNAPWTSGPGTFVEMLIQKAGGENVGSALEIEWAQISIEELVAQNPDVILLGDYTWGGVTAEDVYAREGWQSIAAVQNGRVYEFDDNLVSRPGPRMVDGLEAMARLLHPDQFE